MDQDQAFEFSNRLKTFAEDLADQMSIEGDQLRIEVTYRLDPSPYTPIMISFTLQDDAVIEPVVLLQEPPRTRGNTFGSSANTSSNAYPPKEGPNT